MKLGILFAGQGSQMTGMGADFYEKYEEFREVFDLLPKEKKQIAWQGTMEELSDTRNTQPVMVAFAAGVWNMLRPELEKADTRPVMAAGLSLGEYSALHSAGVFTAKEAIDLVTLRSMAMTKASEGIECAMSAVLQLDREILKDCCDKAAEKSGKVVSIANYNCPGQIVIAGEKEAVEAAADLAMESGAARCKSLPVSGPFHTEFMKPAGEVLAKEFESVDFKPMDFPVVFNTLGKTGDNHSVAELLVKQVQSSVYFEDTLRFMADSGVDTFLEIGPGKTLSGFVRKTCPGAKTYSITKAGDFEAFMDVLKGEI